MSHRQPGISQNYSSDLGHLPLFFKFLFLYWCSHFHSLFFHLVSSSIKMQSTLQHVNNRIRDCCSYAHRNLVSDNTWVIMGKAFISFPCSSVTVGTKSIMQITFYSCQNRYIKIWDKHLHFSYEFILKCLLFPF